MNNIILNFRTESDQEEVVSSPLPDEENVASYNEESVATSGPGDHDSETVASHQEEENVENNQIDDENVAATFIPWAGNGLLGFGHGPNLFRPTPPGLHGLVGASRPSLLGNQRHSLLGNQAPSLLGNARQPLLGSSRQPLLGNSRQPLLGYPFETSHEAQLPNLFNRNQVQQTNRPLGNLFNTNQESHRPVFPERHHEIPRPNLFNRNDNPPPLHNQVTPLFNQRKQTHCSCVCDM